MRLDGGLRIVHLEHMSMRLLALCGKRHDHEAEIEKGRLKMRGLVIICVWADDCLFGANGHEA